MQSLQYSSGHMAFLLQGIAGTHVVRADHGRFETPTRALVQVSPAGVWHVSVGSRADAASVTEAERFVRDNHLELFAHASSVASLASELEGVKDA